MTKLTLKSSTNFQGMHFLLLMVVKNRLVRSSWNTHTHAQNPCLNWFATCNESASGDMSGAVYKLIWSPIFALAGSPTSAAGGLL